MINVLIWKLIRSFFSLTKIKKEITKLVSYAICSKNKDEKSVYWGNINTIKANEIFLKTGLNIEGYSYEIDSSSIRHIFKHHSDKVKETNLKQVAISKKDFLLIPEILENYDIVVKGKKRKSGTYSIIFIKQIGKTYYIVEEVRKKKKTLALKTMYIKGSSI
ncbi:MAG: hypothetical protein IIA88_05300 [Bacteroidetes bacterium]|nr:hypothetical protein [Bacteroidota bacterium]